MVEDVLVHEEGEFNKLKNRSLNPCCGGRCSSTWDNCTRSIFERGVLILVVVEDVLVLEVKVPNVEKPIVLILVVVEDVLVPLYRSSQESE